MTKIVEFPELSLIEKEASQWVVKFESDHEPSQKDIENLHAWMNRSPRHKAVLMEYATLWDEMSILSELKVASSQLVDSRGFFVEKIRLALLSKVMSLLAFIVQLENWFGRASLGVRSILVVLPIALLIAWQVANVYEPERLDNIYITGVGETDTVSLSDGSTFWLNTDSEISVEYSELKRRIVLRKGEAYFQVAHDPARPFEVFAGSRVVRAVGTAFSVYKEPGRVRISVTEGKVDLAVVRSMQTQPLSSLSGNSGVVADGNVTDQPIPVPQEEISEVFGSLGAGQIIELFDREGSSGEEELVLPILDQDRQDLTRRLSWREGQLVFAGESLEEVVREVNRYTSVKIEIVDPEIRGIRVGGQFRVGETEALFDVLQSGFGVKITRLNNQHVQIHAVQ